MKSSSPCTDGPRDNDRDDERDEVSPARVVRMDENVKRYKPLLSSAPVHSILSAQAFNYTNSVDTDIGKMFARIRIERAHGAVIANIGSHVRCVTTKARDTSVPRRPVQSIM